MEMSGKVRKKGSPAFLDLHDQFGSIQLRAPLGELRMESRFNAILPNSFITIIGHVELRPPAAVNGTHENGALEILVRDILRVQRPQFDLSTSSSGFGQNQQQKRQFSTTASPTATPGVVNRSVTATEYAKTSGCQNLIEEFKNRKRTCGELRLEHAGEIVELVGWFGMKRGRFVALNDGHGDVQLVVDKANAPLFEQVHSVKDAELVKVKGIIVGRPETSRISSSLTGDIEISVWDCNVLKGDTDTTAPITEVAKPFIATPPPVPVKKSRIQQQIRQKSTLAANSLKSQSAEEKLSNCNIFTNRTHTCGELRSEHVGDKVTLCGWLEFERMKKFITLRDGYGSIQVLIPPSLTNKINLDAIPFESIIEVEGTVVSRPEKFENNAMITGNVEVILSELKVLNLSRKNLPVEVRNFNRAKETLRLENRYVDLRFADMQKNLRTRSAVLMKMREYLINECAFVEVETPTLFRRTPGGAQEFIVPTQKPGHFYSLVQSPQQFKQMLMAGAIDR